MACHKGDTNDRPGLHCSTREDGQIETASHRSRLGGITLGRSQTMKLSTSLLAMAATGAIVALGLWLANRQIKPPAVSFPDDLDGSVLNQLVQAGADLSKPHDPEFFLYLPDKSAAERVAGTLRAEGFQVEVTRAAVGDNWLCLATKTLVLTHEGMTTLRKRFTAIVVEYRGEYDGWGSEVVR